MMLSERQKAEILEVIAEPVHACGVYEDYMIPALWKEIEKVMKKFGKDASEFQSTDIIRKINNYIKSNVSIRSQYFSFMNGLEEFDTDELFFRTALAALQKHEAMCAGYTEATRCLLAVYGYKSYTLISKLPGANKQLLHYVCVVQNDDGKYVVLDPEREGACERKGYDFQKYLNGMTYIVPGNDFCNEKIGSTGVGIRASDYLARSTTICRGFDEIGELIEIMEEKRRGKT